MQSETSGWNLCAAVALLGAMGCAHGTARRSLEVRLAARPPAYGSLRVMRPLIRDRALLPEEIESLRYDVQALVLGALPDSFAAAGRGSMRELEDLASKNLSPSGGRCEVGLPVDEWVEALSRESVFLRTESSCEASTCTLWITLERRFGEQRDVLATLSVSRAKQDTTPWSQLLSQAKQTTDTSPSVTSREGDAGALHVVEAVQDVAARTPVPLADPLFARCHQSGLVRPHELIASVLVSPDGHAQSCSVTEGEHALSDHDASCVCGVLQGQTYGTSTTGSRVVAYLMDRPEVRANVRVEGVANTRDLLAMRDVLERQADGFGACLPANATLPTSVGVKISLSSSGRLSLLSVDPSTGMSSDTVRCIERVIESSRFPCSSYARERVNFSLVFGMDRTHAVP